MENHSLEEGYTIYSTKKDNQCNLRNPIRLQQKHKKVAHRNHSIEYIPVEENATKLENDYRLKEESYQPFYEN